MAPFLSFYLIFNVAMIIVHYLLYAYTQLQVKCAKNQRELNTQCTLKHLNALTGDIRQGVR